MSKYYLFGYGSLINSESRNKTGNSSEAVPVRVMGIQRSWNFPILSAKARALGAVEKGGSACNGVIISVTESDLSAFDKREFKVGYKRVILNRETIVFLGDGVPEGTVWAYIGENPQTPPRATPIIQSYIDVIMTGCLSFGEPFAKEFVLTTVGWDAPWINDRASPRYPRAMSEVPLAQTIDRLLEELVPEAFHRRK